MSTVVDIRRVRSLKEGEDTTGPVVYWMIRDQRVQDNWALLYAQQQAIERGRPLHVVFCLRPDLRTHAGTRRMWNFMRTGLEQVAQQLTELGIGFHFLLGDPVIEVAQLLQQKQASLLVTDFFPLRVYRDWKTSLAQKITISIHEVDAHNIVPCWMASTKQEFAARTFRPKITRLLSEFLTAFPLIKSMPTELGVSVRPVNWRMIERQVLVNESVQAIDWCQPGEKEAEAVWQAFMSQGLSQYAGDKNDPTKHALSNMSPYLHFGQISAQRLAWDLRTANHAADAEVYFEELVVRRELSDNFCFYNSKYDSVEGFPEWARKTLQQHRTDQREAVYRLSAFANAQTAEPLWNAAQIQMVQTGKMHGYLRMYWAKKILEWSSSPEQAMKIAIELNDLYSLDGRDPNGYVGIAWSIGGVHDRPWFDRPIYGQVRYMSQSGAVRKFDVQQYINSWTR